MQTVWSRAAQARCVCSCPSCRLTNNAIARRATTATARRAIRVGDVFTVSISSLAAGLAFTDSRRKDDRSKQWDKAIGEARASVEATEIQQQNRLAALSDGARMEVLDRSSATRHDITADRAVKDVEAWDVEESEEEDQRNPTLDIRDDDTWLDVFNWAREQHLEREASGFQDWKGPPLSLLQSLSRAQLNEFLYNERLLRRFYGGPDCHSLVDDQSSYPFSTKKLRTIEWSVARMVLRLLTYCSNDSQLRQGSGCPTNLLLRELLKDGGTVGSRLDHTRQRLSTLHAMCNDRRYYEEFASPSVPNYDDTIIEANAQTREMNILLQKLLGHMKQETDMSDLMSKICYNLLTARTPPNTDTYNMLLVRFCVLEKEHLVRLVLMSMRESHIRPNEITHATLLRHFTAIGNRIGFVKCWRRLEGYRGGLALANPKQNIHPVAKERYLIFGRNHHKAAEKGRMNGQVYESLIVGAFKFLGAQTAMHYYRNMISEGWSPSLGIWLAILQDCCHRLDWTVGTAVLEQLEKTTERMNTLAYEWMLRLCQCCGQQEYFDQIMRNGVHCGALPESILDIPDQFKAEDIAFLLERAKNLQPGNLTGSLEKTAARISYRLDDKNPSLLHNIFRDCDDQDKLRYWINRADSRYRARLALEKRLYAISTDMYHTMVEANTALYGPEHLTSVRFLLSQRVGYLEKELEQEFEQDINAVAYASYSDLVLGRKPQPIQVKRLLSGEDDSDTSVTSPVTARFPHSEAECITHIPPGSLFWRDQWLSGNAWVVD